MRRPNGLKYGSNGTTVDAKFDGKVTDVVHWKASDDGKTLSFSDEDKLHNTTTTFVEDRVN